jgi:hypothetical protein
VFSLPSLPSELGTDVGVNLKGNQESESAENLCKSVGDGLRTQKNLRMNATKDCHLFCGPIVTQTLSFASPFLFLALDLGPARLFF